MYGVLHLSPAESIIQSPSLRVIIPRCPSMQEKQQAQNTRAYDGSSERAIISVLSGSIDRAFESSIFSVILE